VYEGAKWAGAVEIQGKWGGGGGVDVCRGCIWTNMLFVSKRGCEWISGEMDGLERRYASVGFEGAERIFLECYACAGGGCGTEEYAFGY
jgi:hypothetical protein